MFSLLHNLLYGSKVYTHSCLVISLVQVAESAMSDWASSPYTERVFTLYRDRSNRGSRKQTAP